MRIGSIDDPLYSLTEISRAVPLPSGGVISTHPSEGLIRHFDTDGTLVYAVGGLGDGPGEFDRLGHVTLLGDSLAVVDSRAGVISYLDVETGVHLESNRLSIGSIDFEDRRLQLSRFLSQDAVVATPSTPSHLVASGEITTFDFVLLNRDGTPIDTLPPIRRGNGQWAVQFESGGGAFGRQAFSDETLWHITSDAGMVLLDRQVGAEPTIYVTRITSQADTLWATPLDFDPQPISDAEVDSIIGIMVPESPVFGRTPAQYEQAWRRSFYRPAHRPGATAILEGSDGHVWVAGTAGPESTTWWVLSEDGELEYTVALPSSVRVLAATANRVWASESDELDVPYLVAFDLQAPSGEIPD